LIATFSQAIIIVLYYVFTKYGDGAVASSSVMDVNNGSIPSSELDHYYPMFQDVHGENPPSTAATSLSFPLLSCAHPSHSSRA
jgi:hypothetical protein